MNKCKLNQKKSQENLIDNCSPSNDFYKKDTQLIIKTNEILKLSHFSINIESTCQKAKVDIDYLNVIEMIFLYLKGKVTRELYDNLKKHCSNHILTLKAINSHKNRKLINESRSSSSKENNKQKNISRNKKLSSKIGKETNPKENNLDLNIQKYKKINEKINLSKEIHFNIASSIGKLIKGIKYPKNILSKSINERSKIKNSLKNLKMSLDCNTSSKALKIPSNNISLTNLSFNSNQKILTHRPENNIKMNIFNEKPNIINKGCQNSTKSKKNKKAIGKNLSDINLINLIDLNEDDQRPKNIEIQKKQNHNQTKMPIYNKFNLSINSSNCTNNVTKNITNSSLLNSTRAKNITPVTNYARPQSSTSQMKLNNNLINFLTKTNKISGESHKPNKPVKKIQNSSKNQKNKTAIKFPLKANITLTSNIKSERGLKSPSLNKLEFDINHSKKLATINSQSDITNNSKTKIPNSKNQVSNTSISSSNKQKVVNYSVPSNKTDINNLVNLHEVSKLNTISDFTNPFRLSKKTRELSQKKSAETLKNNKEMIYDNPAPFIQKGNLTDDNRVYLKSSKEFIKEINLRLADTLKPLQNFSYEHFMVNKEKEINDSLISKKEDFESINLKSTDERNIFNDIEFDAIIQNHKGIMFTNEISFDENDQRLKNIVFKKK